MSRHFEIPYTEQELEEGEVELRILQQRVGANALDIYPHYVHWHKLQKEEVNLFTDLWKHE